MDSTKPPDDSDADDSGDPLWDDDESEKTVPHSFRNTPRGRSPEILGNFQVIREIGRGGMGIVYEAEELELGRRVALKVLPHGASLRSSHKQRFLNEARAAAQLNHDHIVPVYHIGEDNGIHFFAMKLIEGCDLSQLIHRLRETVQSAQYKPGSVDTHSNGPTTANAQSDTHPGSKDSSTSGLSSEIFTNSMKRNGYRSAAKIAQNVALIGQQIAEALEHAHQCGIIHRDIKPSNIMLDRDGRVWVTDFGLAHLQDAPGVTQTGVAVGTWRYMSPEQASGHRNFLDHRTDIYSLGVALYELATLQSACRGANAREILRELTLERPTPIRKINPRLPRDFETIICKATERNPNDRYQTAAAMAEDLERLINKQSIQAKRTSKWRYMRDWLYQRPGVVTVASAITLVIVSLLTTSLWALYGQLVSSEGARLRAESNLVLAKDKNSGRALELAVHSHPSTPGFETDQAILAALQELREARRIGLGNAQPGPLVFSPDGNKLVKCVDNRFYFSQLGRAILYDAQTGKELYEFPDSHRLTSAVYSPNSQHLLTSGTSFPIVAPDAAKRAGLERFEFTPVTVWNANSLGDAPKLLTQTRVFHLGAEAFSKIQPRAVLPAADANAAIVFDTNDWSREELRLVRDEDGRILQAIYSPDGKWIATWSEKHSLVIWDAETAKMISAQTLAKIGAAERSHLFFTPDSKSVVIQSTLGTWIIALADPNQIDFHRESKTAFLKQAGSILMRGLSLDSMQLVQLPDKQLVEFNLPAAIDQILPIEQSGLVATSLPSQNSVLLLDMQDGSIKGECRGHSDQIYDLRLRPGAAQIATISWDDSIRFWNLRSDSENRRLTTGKTLISPMLDVSPNGKRALLGTVLSQQSQSHSIAAGVPGSLKTAGEVKCVLTDGTWVIADKQWVVLLNSRTAQRIAQLSLVNDTLSEAHSIDGTNDLILHTQSGALITYAANEKQFVRLTTHGDNVSSVAVDSAHRRIWAGTFNGHLLRIDMDSHKAEQVENVGQAIVHLDYEPSRDRLLISTGNHRIATFETDNSKLAWHVTAHEGQIGRAWFTADGASAVSHGFNGDIQVCLWKLDTGELIDKIDHQATAVRPHPQRQSFAIAALEGSLLWNVVDQTRETITTERCFTLAFCDQHLVVGTMPETQSNLDGPIVPSTEAKLIAWNVMTKQKTWEQAIGLNTESLNFDPSSQQVVLSGSSYGVDVFDLQNSQHLSRLLGHSSPVVAAHFLPDNQSVVVVSLDGFLKIHDSQSLSQTSLGQHGYAISAAQITPDREFLITCDRNGRTLQWDLKKRQQDKELKPQGDNWSRQLTMAGNGSLFLLADNHERLEVFDMRSSKPVPIKIDQAIQHVTVSPNGKHAFVLCGQSPVKVSTSRSSDSFANVDWKSETVVIDLERASTQKVQLEGTFASAKFLPDNKHVALLSNHGELSILALNGFKIVRQWPTSPRAVTFDVSDASQLLFSHSRTHVSAWKWQTGEQVLEVELPTLGKSSDTQVHAWPIDSPSTEWYLLREPTGAIKIPKNLIDYARSRLP